MPTDKFLIVWDTFLLHLDLTNQIAPLAIKDNVIQMAGYNIIIGHYCWPIIHLINVDLLLQE